MATAALLASFAGAVQGHAQMPTVLYKGHEAHATRILAQVKAGTSLDEQVSTLARERVLAARDYSLVPGLVMLEIDEPVAVMRAGETPEAAQARQAQQLHATIEALQRSGLYEYVEPDYIVRPHRVPTDGAFTDGRLWGLRNTGQNGGTAGVDIDAVRAWDITTGSSDVIVAVIDSGIRYTHQDLAANMWRNPGEIPGNGIDDDGNGFIDDVHGINAVNDSGNPMDDDGHGTHVAGTIGAVANNAGEHVGVAWNVRLMALKFLSAQGDGTTSDAIESIAYAVEHGARVINASWGSSQYSRALAEAIAAADARDVLVVASAGNTGTSAETWPVYPASLDAPNVVSVAAHDRQGRLAVYSTFGDVSVDLAAPGHEVVSTHHVDDAAYFQASGTSAAAPHVSGVAALVWSKDPGLRMREVRSRILQSAIRSTALTGRVATGGRLSAYEALVAAGDGRLDLEVHPRSATTLYSGRAVSVEVRVSDLVAITGATVVGQSVQAGSLVFRDDGQGGDRSPDDGIYSAWLTPPSGVQAVVLDVAASAAGLEGAFAEIVYPVAEAAVNDDFADRIRLLGTSATVLASNVGATRETGESRHHGLPGGASVWWSWIAPGSGNVEIRTNGSDFDTVLAVYSGDALERLVPVASNDDVDGYSRYSRVRFAVTGGVDYAIAVDSPEGSSGRIIVDLNSDIRPANDDFAARVPLAEGGPSLNGTLRNASREVGEPVHATSADGAGSVWYTWTAATSSVARIEVTEGAALAVYRGIGVANLNPVALPTVDPPSLARFAAVAGEAYQISVTPTTHGFSSLDFELRIETVEGPVNDCFAARSTLVGDDASGRGTFDDATREDAEPVHTSSDAGGSVWWTWTAPESGTAILLCTGDHGPPTVAVYRGEALAELALVVSGRGGTTVYTTTRVAFAVQSGDVFQIALDDAGEASGDYSLTLAMVGTPGNDAFANRRMLAGDAVVLTGTNVGATREPGEPSLDLGAAGATLWWSWTAPRDGTVRVSVGDSRTIVGVFTGQLLSALEPVADHWFPTAGSLVRRQFRATAGTAYHIALDSAAHSMGEQSAMLQIFDAPPNDDFADRTLLSGAAARVVGDLSYATRESSEPESTDRTVSVWWTWTAPRDGLVMVTGFAPVGIRPPFVWVFTGSELASSSQVLDPYDWRGERRSRRVFRAVGGQTYAIAATGNAESGPFEMELGYAAPPANDGFDGRIALGTAPIRVTGTTMGAGREPGEPEHDSAAYGASVWWTWTAPADGTVIASVQESSILASLFVYRGGSVGTLESLGGSNQGGGRVAFLVQGGVEYQIAVEGRNGDMGDVALALDFAATPRNDDFADADELSGDAIRFTSTTAGSTGEAGEPTVAPGLPNSVSRWWKWVASRDGVVESVLGSADSDQRIRIFTGDRLDTLANVTHSLSDARRIRFRVEEGTTYWIQISARRGTGAEFDLALRVHDGPINDQFANRREMAGAEVVVVDDASFATVEADERTLLQLPEGPSVWWRWVAPESGRLVVTLDAEESGDVEVFEGASLQALVRRGSSKFGIGQTVADVSRGNEYVIRCTFSEGLPYRMHAVLVEPPDNDAFARRQSLAGESVVVSGSTIGATAEQGEPTHRGRDADTSLWWGWVAPRSGIATFGIQGEDGTLPTMIVYRGGGLGELSSPESLGGGAIEVTAGTEYQIAVDRGNERMGAFTFRLGIHEPPANNGVASAATLAGTEVVANASNVGAYRENGEPWAGVGSASDPTVWWRWVAPADGRTVVEVASADLRPGIAVFDGYPDGIQPGFARGWSEFLKDGSAVCAFDAVAGRTYYLVVVSGPVQQGTFTLRLRQVEAPTNDNFADRLELHGYRFETAANNLGATAESWEGPGRDLPGNPVSSVWWRWTAPAAGLLTLEAEGPDVPLVLGVFTGDAPQALALRSSSHAPRGAVARVESHVQAGVEYAWCVSGQDGRVGAFQLRADLLASPVVEARVAVLPAEASGRLEITADVSNGGEDSTVQWLLDGRPLPGANSLTLSLPMAQRFHSGIYQVVLTGRYGTTTSEGVHVEVAAATETTTSRLSNLSTRALCGTDDGVLIPGFVVRGGGTRVLARALGPTLTDFGLNDFLPDPRFVVKRLEGQTSLDRITNADWSDALEGPRIAAIGDELGAYPLHARSRDAAVLVDLAPGAYSIVTDDSERRTGVAIVELYEVATRGTAGRLVNLSNRGFVGVGEAVMIPGFVIGGEGHMNLLLRAVGPGLSGYGVAGVLADPRLTVYRTDPATGAQVPILWNDNWGENGDAADIAAVAEQVGAFELEPGSKDAAFVITLQPGVYTVHAAGADGGTGVALVELYLVD
ncbi:hypothetical protein ASA1KI_41790 [Opitutales bacterium ASA1]|nr:hypothetical protein ASA1KI_41790 [Opitutales bacterium ASA1]